MHETLQKFVVLVVVYFSLSFITDLGRNEERGLGGDRKQRRLVKKRPISVDDGPITVRVHGVGRENVP